MGWLSRTIIKQGVAAQRARVFGMIFAFIFIVALLGLFALALLHSASSANTVHTGLHIYVESAMFTNSSGSSDFITEVKNTGTVVVDTVNIMVTETGSMIGTISSIPVGKTANITIPVNGLTNNTLYTLEYSATSGNLTYTTTIPVLT
jgi:hypothetical protein